MQTSIPAPPSSFRYFVTASLGFALTFGAALGAALLATKTLPHDFLAGFSIDGVRTAHAHAQVFGFATLFVMGVAHHALPRLKGAPPPAPRLVLASFWLQAGGVLAVALGALAATPRGAALRLAGTLAMLAAAIVFERRVARILAAGPPSAERLEPWLRCGCAWLIIASALSMLAAAGATALQPAVWDAALFGFASSWIFGFSLRILPAFLGVAPAASGRGAVCAIYQGAVAAWVLADAATSRPFAMPGALAGIGLAAAGGLAVLRLRPFARRAVAQGAGNEAGSARLVRAAYFWFLIGIGCGPLWSAAAALAGGLVPSLVLDFARHALTLGFLAQMIIGVSTRIVPAFSGRGLWSWRWRDATFVLLNAAVLLRALQVVVELGGPEVAWRWIALSGVLGFAAFVAFVVNLGMTVAGRGPAVARGGATPA